jgi:hypothetical protein
MGQRDCRVTGAREARALDGGTLCRQRSTSTVPAGGSKRFVKPMAPAQPPEVAGQRFPELLVPMRMAYERELAEYIARNRHSLTKWLDIDNGTASNAIGGAGWMASGLAYLITWVPKAASEKMGWESETLEHPHRFWEETMKASLRTGCLDLQSQTYGVLSSHGVRGWDIKDWMVGNVFEHHAINVHPEGSDGRDGWIFDPWITLSPQVYPFADWMDHFTGLSVLGNARAEW